MSTRILSDEQRRKYGCFGEHVLPSQIARYFHLDAIDRGLIEALRGDHNRLGFALQLGTVRFLGTYPEIFETIPINVIEEVAMQIGIAPDISLNDYGTGRQRWRHMGQINAFYGFRRFEEAGFSRFQLTRWLYSLCWTGDDRPGQMMERAISWLIANKVLLPGVTTLERFVGRIRDRAQQRLWHRLVSSLNVEQRARIARLFDASDPGAFSTLDALRKVPRRRAPSEFYTHLDRLDQLRDKPRR